METANQQNFTNCFGNNKSENLTEYTIHANISKINVYDVMKKFDSSRTETTKLNQSFVNETGFILVNETREEVMGIMDEIKIINQRNNTKDDNETDLMREKRATAHLVGSAFDMEHIPRLQEPDSVIFERQENLTKSIFGNSM